jgi:hypothetical protein
MIVQWWCKGLRRLDRSDVEGIFGNPVGLLCQDWLNHARAGEPLPIDQAMRRLTEADLHRHVNDFSGPDPATGRPFHEVTPFISLSAGCVDRDVLAKTNRCHRAIETALDFATNDYSDPAKPRCPGWVLFGYVIVGSNPAVDIPGVAEEVRELNHNRPFSGWYWQGEVAAKINVSAAQISQAQRWEPLPGGRSRCTAQLPNPWFRHPAALLPERSTL